MKIDIPQFEQAKVLVVGDVMLDRYWSGSATRVSPEAPVPVVRVEEEEQRAGGAGNVAFNIAALGGSATLLGVVGNDSTGDEIEKLLEGSGVDCDLIHSKEWQTVSKLRILSRHQQLLRADFESNNRDKNNPNDPIFLSQLEDKLSQHIKDAGTVILSDYGKGTLDNIQKLIAIAKKHGKPVLIDPKGQDYSRYSGATLITPNLSELQAVVGNIANEEELVEKAENLRQKLNLTALLVTRSEDGMTLLQENFPPMHLPTHARDVYDVTGAGDTVIAVLATSLSSSMGMPDATRLANLAAGLVVGKVGTATTNSTELHRALHDDFTDEYGVLTEDELSAAIKQAQARGEKVIMTNGCFDLLHAGHVTYLEQARKLGDRLVVAVNSDESVKMLKGDSRPLNELSTRMTILSALQSVDWVIPFAEETPERLYCKVLPDTIVKGGDYKPEEIAGGKCVIANGGEVKVLEFLDGHSTTNIINKIQEDK